MRLKFFLTLIISLSFVLRFYNLDWSKGIVWHPDERNMAVAVERFHLPKSIHDFANCFRSRPEALDYEAACNLNPRFFAYGGLPLYLGFFAGLGATSFDQRKIVHSLTFREATFWLRVVSALSSVLTVLVSYKLAKLFFSENLSLAVSLFASLVPSSIQNAHFGTTESLISLLILATIHLSIFYYQTGKLRYFFWAAILTGFSFSTKVSAFPLIVTPLLSFVFLAFRKNYSLPKKLSFLFLHGLFLVTLGLLALLITSPFYFLSFNDFKGTLKYESDVALGRSPVFYTRQFINTTPLLFQLEKIFPYALGYPLTILGLFGFIFSLFQGIFRKRWELLILGVTFFVFLIPNLLIFAKWVRFISPVFPLFALGAVYFISLFRRKLIANLGLVVVFFSLLLQSLAFFAIYLENDVRFLASDWIFRNIPTNSTILSETANVSDIPVLPENQSPRPNYRVKLVSFNFYDLDAEEKLQEDLIRILINADYILIPSRRIFKNHLRLKEKYPILNRYYLNLFSGSLGFEKAAEFRNLSLLPYDEEDAEETFTVFDHPVVRIYKKVNQLSQTEYRKLLRIGLTNYVSR